MTEDWRAVVQVDGDGVVGELLERFRAGAVEHEATRRLGDRVVISHSDDRLFLYTASEDDARIAERVVRELLPRHDLRAVGSAVQRWHDVEEQWEDADAPLPHSEGEVAAEEERLEARERAESREAGVPQWEVRVTLPDAAAAREYAERLQGEGIPVARRSQHVMVGAESEADARALADRLQAGAPPGARFEVEGNGQPWWSALHPFAVFGGIAN